MGSPAEGSGLSLSLKRIPGAIPRKDTKIFFNDQVVWSSCALLSSSSTFFYDVFTGKMDSSEFHRENGGIHEIDLVRTGMFELLDLNVFKGLCTIIEMLESNETSCLTGNLPYCVVACDRLCFHGEVEKALLEVADIRDPKKDKFVSKTMRFTPVQCYKYGIPGRFRNFGHSLEATDPREYEGGFYTYAMTLVDMCYTQGDSRINVLDTKRTSGEKEDKSLSRFADECLNALRMIDTYYTDNEKFQASLNRSVETESNRKGLELDKELFRDARDLICEKLIPDLDLSRGSRKDTFSEPPTFEVLHCLAPVHDLAWLNDDVLFRVSSDLISKRVKMIEGLSVTRDLSPIDAFHIFDSITFCDKNLEYTTDDVYKYIRKLGSPDGSLRSDIFQKILPIKMGYVTIEARDKANDCLLHSIYDDAVRCDELSDELRVVSFLPDRQDNFVKVKVTCLDLNSDNEIKYAGQVIDKVFKLRYKFNIH